MAYRRGTCGVFLGCWIVGPSLERSAGAWHHPATAVAFIFVGRGADAKPSRRFEEPALVWGHDHSLRRHGAQRPGRGVDPLLARPGDRVLPQRLLRDGPARHGAAHGVRGDDRRIPGVLGGGRQRPVDAAPRPQLPRPEARRPLVPLRAALEGSLRRRRRAAGGARFHPRGDPGHRAAGRAQGLRGRGLRRPRLRPRLGQHAVEVGAAVAEEAPGRAVGLQEIQVEGRRQHALVLAVEAGDEVAAMVGDEAGAVEHLTAAGVALRSLLEADAVGADHGDDVRHRMALHGAPPRVAGVEAGVVRLRTDGGRIEQHLGPHQRHGPRGLGVPLVPADADAQAAEAAVPDAEAGVAGAEIVLFLVARPVGDVAFAIEAHQRAVGVDHHQAVEIVRPLALEDRDRNDHAQFGGQRRQGGDAGMLAPGIGVGEPAFFLADAEIGPLEQLRRQDHLRAEGRRLADELGGLGDVGRHVLAVRGLDGGDADGAGHDQTGSC